MKISPDFAKLSPNQIEKIQQLENSEKIILVAYEKLPKLADLNPEEIQRLQEFEEKLGFRLVAWK